MRIRLHASYAHASEPERESEPGALEEFDLDDVELVESKVFA